MPNDAFQHDPARTGDDARARTLALVAIVSLVVLRALLALRWPASGDAQVFLWLADLATSGGVPYRDAFETKGPMAWMPLAPLVAIAGPAAWIPRVVDLVMMLVGAFAARRVAERMAGTVAGADAATLWAAWWCGGDWWNTAQPDGWASAWIIAAWALASGTVGARVMAGALIGAAAMVKPFYAPFLIVPMLATGATDLRAAVRACPPLVFGFAVGVALPVLWLARLGALDAWLACLGWTASIYSAGEGIIPYLAPLVVDAMRPPAGVVALPAVVAIPVLLRSRRRADAAALAIGTVGALLVVLVQRRFWPYHWLPLQPFLAIGFGVVVAALMANPRARTAHDAGRWMATAAFAIALIAPAQLVKHAIGASRGPAAWDAWQQTTFGAYGHHRDGVLAIVDSLHRTGAPGDRALVWGFYPGVETLLGGRPATRYAIMRPLFDGEGTRARDSIRTAFLREIDSLPPRWWLVARETMRERREEFDAWAPRNFPAVDSLLRVRYRIVGQTRDWVIREITHR